MSTTAAPSRAQTIGLGVAALGVVFGDIGTSPLYAMRETFHGHHLPVTPDNVLGVCSLIFWALIIVVSIKYVAFVLRADNRGEGGILALTSLVTRPRVAGSAAALIILGLFGTSLLYGDGVITPAISVLAAVEGLGVAAPSMSSWILPLAIGILIGLFAVQRRGTGAVGKVFGPVMLVWFAVLFLLGITNAVTDPGVFAAVNPTWGAQFLINNPLAGFLSLGSVFLVVTGGEALYADLGHFGRGPIRLGWFAVAFPALMMNYFGQGALLISDPEAIESPLFLMGPDWATWPMVALATAATVIASQALISGAFSMTVQAVQLGYLPRVSIRHTSADHHGQVYVPSVNWLLAGGCIALVLAFRSSSNLAAAYGIAVTGTMAITTILFYVFTRTHWQWSKAKAVALTAPLLVIDLGFFGANVAKIPDGGWFPLFVAAILLTMMTTWFTGRALVADRLERGQLPIGEFLDTHLPTIARIPGVAAFMFRGEHCAPPALVANVKANRVLHDTTLLVSVETTDTPTVADTDRLAVHDHGHGVYQLIVSYGFMETPDIDNALAELELDGERVDMESCTYFLGRETVVSTPEHAMARWREHLFVFQLRVAASAARFFRLPARKVIEVGTIVEV